MYTVTNDNGILHIRAIISTAEEKADLIAKIEQAWTDRDKMVEPSMKENMR